MRDITPYNDEIKMFIFKQLFDENRTFEGITKEIESLKEEREIIKAKERRPYHRKIIKDINKKVTRLDKLKRKFTVKSSVTGDISDPEPIEIVTVEVGYVFKSESRKKTGSGNKRKKRDEIFAKKSKKKRKW